MVAKSSPHQKTSASQPQLQSQPQSRPQSRPRPSSQPKQPLSPPHLAFIALLAREYPQFTFKPSKRFTFRPPKTILLGAPQPFYPLLALHELGHALCQHSNYHTHIERLKIESEAWQMAKNLYDSHPEWGKTFDFAFDQSFVEDQLDTYRNWLHQKSTCPHCHLSRYQTPDGQYHCPHCDLTN